jgi:hypothetical protein
MVILLFIEQLQEKFKRQSPLSKTRACCGLALQISLILLGSRG